MCKGEYAAMLLLLHFTSPDLEQSIKSRTWLKSQENTLREGRKAGCQSPRWRRQCVRISPVLVGALHEGVVRKEGREIGLSTRIFLWTCTLWGLPSFVIFCWKWFGKILRLVGWYCSYLLPKQVHTTTKVKHNKTSRIEGTAQIVDRYQNVIR